MFAVVRRRGGKFAVVRQRGGKWKAGNCLEPFSTRYVDGFQMSIKRSTSGGQACDQEAAVQLTFHLKRSSFFYLSS